MPSNKKWANEIRATDRFSIGYTRFVSRIHYKTRKEANQRARSMRALIMSSFNVSDTRFEIVGPRRIK